MYCRRSRRSRSLSVRGVKRFGEKSATPSVGWLQHGSGINTVVIHNRIQSPRHPFFMWPIDAVVACSFVVLVVFCCNCFLILLLPACFSSQIVCVLAYIFFCLPSNSLRLALHGQFTFCICNNVHLLWRMHSFHSRQILSLSKRFFFYSFRAQIDKHHLVDPGISYTKCSSKGSRRPISLTRIHTQ